MEECWRYIRLKLLNSLSTRDGGILDNYHASDVKSTNQTGLF